MQTHHTVTYADSARMQDVASHSVDLIVTSPPYPMIDMWDELFCGRDAAVRRALAGGDGPEAFALMHGQLEAVWREMYRVLRPGGFACINIGDAVRTFGGTFSLYPNHARIINAMLDIGFRLLPFILWRKQTNAPNKFMGSGMLPAGAYVTLEHEYVLIFRKGDKRVFKTEAEKETRRQSAIFWEERNQWFSDVWFDLKGTRQALAGGEARKRSAAFPFALAHRLVLMYSVAGDTVLDPFLGIGTTLVAAAAAGRHSIGYEIDGDLQPVITEAAGKAVDIGREANRERLDRHLAFVAERTATKGTPKHRNLPYGFPVVTRQETGIFLNDPVAMEAADSSGTAWVFTYTEGPDQTWQGCAPGATDPEDDPLGCERGAKRPRRSRQKPLFTK